MPQVGIYRRSVIKKVMPSARLQANANASHFGASEAVGLMEGGRAMQNAGSSMMQDSIRQKRIAEQERKQEEREAKAAAKEAAYQAEKAQNIRAEAMGRNASNEFQKELRDLERELYKKQGKDAVGIYEAGSAQIESIRNKYTEGLSDKELKNFSYYSDRRYNSSLDNLSKFDMSAQKGFEIQTLEESITGTTNDLISSRYDAVNAEKALDQISKDAYEIGIKQGMSEPEIKNFMQGKLQGAHLQAVDAMMNDGKFDEANAYLEQHQGEFAPGVLAAKNNEIYEKGVRAKAPQLVKELLEKYPEDTSSQYAALDKIDDAKLRELMRKEMGVQTEIQQTRKKQAEQDMYEKLLPEVLKNPDGVIPLSIDGKPVSVEMQDKARKDRDKLLSNTKGNRVYYYEVKDLMSTGSVEASKLEINPGNLTQEQYFELRDMQSKVRGSVNGGGSGTSSTNWMSPSKQVDVAIDAAFGDDADDKQRARITEACIIRFENENAATIKDRKAIIDEVILDYTPGEEGEGFINENMTYGEAKKQGYKNAFEPDEPDGLLDGSRWSSDVDAWIRPDKSKYGVTLQDGYGRDITPNNLEEGTKWNSSINRFIKKDDRFNIYDKSGRLILDMPLNAKYNRQRKMFIAKERYNDNGYEEEKVMLYTLDGNSYEQRRQQ